MAAANTDLLRKKKSLFSTTLSSGISAVDTSMTLASTSGLPTDTAITLTLDRVDANGVSTPTARERVTGVVNGSVVQNLVRGEDGGGGTGKVHSAGAVVEDVWDAETWNDAMTVLMATHEQASGRIKNETAYAADGGSNDTYAITLSPAPAAYVTGMVVQFKANTANTGACTLNVNSLGAKTIKKWYNSDLNDNDILAGQIVSVVYDGTNFQLISETSVLTSKTLVTPKFADGGAIVDDSGNEYLKFTKTASAVNEINMTNAPTNASPVISPSGGDTNIDLYLKGKGNGSPRFAGYADQWIYADETWTYATANTFTVSGDVSGKYMKGDRVKLYNGSTKYFYIIGISYSAPNTTITVTGGNSYTLANAAITSNFYSRAENPIGFPAYFAHNAPTWDTATIDNGTGGQQPQNGGCYFSIRGNECKFRVFLGTAFKNGAAPYIAFTLPTTTIPAIDTTAHSLYAALGVGWFYNSGNKGGITNINGGATTIRLTTADNTNIADNTALSSTDVNLTFYF